MLQMKLIVGIVLCIGYLGISHARIGDGVVQTIVQPGEMMSIINNRFYGHNDPETRLLSENFLTRHIFTHSFDNNPISSNF